MEETVTDNRSKIGLKTITYSIVALILAGLIGVYYGNKLTINSLELLYVSEAELLLLEKERIKGEEPKKRQLFFGKPQEALKLVEEIGKRSRTSQIVLFSEKTVFGPRTRSISAEVHEEIVKLLGKAEEKENENNKSGAN